jgi:hypothetical protein
MHSTGYFASDKLDELDGIENATHNTFPKLTQIFKLNVIRLVNENVKKHRILTFS